MIGLCFKHHLIYLTHSHIHMSTWTWNFKSILLQHPNNNTHKKNFLLITIPREFLYSCFLLLCKMYLASVFNFLLIFHFSQGRILNFFLLLLYFFITIFVFVWHFIHTYLTWEFLLDFNFNYFKHFYVVD